MSKLKKAFINGKIFTADDKNKWVEAIITNGNRISFTGTNETAKELIDSETQVIDLNNQLVLPGFIDSHAHLVLGGFYLQGIDLSTAKSKNEFRYIFKSFLSRENQGWIQGGNWNHQLFDKVELPSKEWIDDITKNIPVFVHRMDYHMALVNSAALRLAGISNYTPNPIGGEIERNEFGEPTGILKDKAMDLIYKILPMPDSAKYQNAIEMALNETARFGITTVNDISYQNHFLEYQKTLNNGKLKCRIYSIMPIENHEHLIKSEIMCPFGNEKLRIGGMKAFADGSLGSSTAYFFNPYEDNKESCGLAMEILLNGNLRKWAKICDENNLQLIIHAIGDRAISEVIDIYEMINNKSINKDRRFRIEHAQHMHPKDFLRLKQNNIIISAQPYHLYDDGSWAAKKVGEERLKTTYAFKSFLSNDVKLCFGSDWPVSTLNPIEGIYTAVTRHTSDGKNPDGLIPEEKLTVEEAVKCYTINAAYACFDEKNSGSIEINKYADFIVLERDIFNINPDEIKNVNVKMTIFDGELIYKLE